MTKINQKERLKMSRVKLAVVYYSSTGTNYQMALAAREGGAR